MQPLNHDVVVPDAPVVVDHYVSNGRLIPIRCTGDYPAKVQALRLLVRESVPQHAAAMQHDFIDVIRQPA